MSTARKGLKTVLSEHKSLKGLSSALFLPLTSVEKARLKTVLSETYVQGKDKNLFFQFGGDNCGYHVQRLFDKVIAAPFYETLFAQLKASLSTHSPFSQWVH